MRGTKRKRMQESPTDSPALLPPRTRSRIPRPLQNRAFSSSTSTVVDQGPSPQALVEEKKVKIKQKREYMSRKKTLLGISKRLLNCQRATEQEVFLKLYEVLSLHLDEVTPIENIKENKRKPGTSNPSDHALKSRKCRKSCSDNARRLKTLVQDNYILERITRPNLLEWANRQLVKFNLA